MDDKPPTQMAFSAEQVKLLQQIPDCLWSEHKTDVGLVKSVQPVEIKLKTGAKLPYERQYPPILQAMAGIKPTIGLLQAGVLVKTQSLCNSPIFPIKKTHSNDYRLVYDLHCGRCRNPSDT